MGDPCVAIFGHNQARATVTRCPKLPIADRHRCCGAAPAEPGITTIKALKRLLDKGYAVLFRYENA
jgi:hypothetical protein